jgi:hypothetical protein
VFECKGAEGISLLVVISSYKTTAYPAAPLQTLIYATTPLQRQNMKSDITNAEIKFHLTKNNFESSIFESLKLIFFGSSLIGIVFCCCYLIVSEWSSNIYGLNILLLLFFLMLWPGIGSIYEGMFPLFGELILTVNSEELCITRKILINIDKRRIPTKDILEIGQLYFNLIESGEVEDPPILVRKCFVKTQDKQIFFCACIEQGEKDMILSKINDFVFEK